MSTLKQSEISLSAQQSQRKEKIHASLNTVMPKEIVNIIASYDDYRTEDRLEASLESIQKLIEKTKFYSSTVNIPHDTLKFIQEGLKDIKLEKVEDTVRVLNEIRRNLDYMNGENPKFSNDANAVVGTGLSVAYLGSIYLITSMIAYDAPYLKLDITDHILVVISMLLLALLAAILTVAAVNRLAGPLLSPAETQEYYELVTTCRTNIDSLLTDLTEKPEVDTASDDSSSRPL